ncbi:hypothetical protein QWJ39_05100 [Arthrobacter sp. YD4]|uniref:hypothetical protein n=1 Tax=Arthrobacter sp. YD4 TaxID=3058043 RepID=UPI0025B2C1EF|nr:hypothetical protein [Arthrobacter sp. YD4]MDN3935686.1 hypothetical protein [Arthrobacter sp. YD4]
MEAGHKPSVISRLLHEISWEGRKVKLYRDGGRGMENALTAEVFQGLSNLPRDMFLGEILRCAHGADEARLAAAIEVEHSDLDVLPGSLPLPALGIDVQPDVWMTGSSVQVLVEAKGFKKGAGFNREQLPRELLCLEAHSGGRTPLLLLILASPPPIKLTGNGFHEVDAGVAVGLDSVCERAGMTHEEYERLRTAIPACVAWITWEEIHAVVMRQKGALSGLPSSIAASVHRTADGVAQAIRWHSSGVVTDLVEFAEGS